MDISAEVDQFGRILLPKKLREALHVKAGGRLYLHLEGEQLTITPEYRTATIRMEDGLPVIEFANKTRIIGDPVAEMREARERELLDRLSGE
ncbi:AbrB/MazE/SpoVT family DNA-binding domain-containing protein [Deinococcus sp.]|uniref:AbrB/MazE/SpoVT family DNA-binding domain-containing protein n=1 Tax=Deinococcus sp. TaxID=47478 RepID=UPI0025E2A4AC|nr:AbrB/MazE/SpoVT family DNA-binding domain-containing protein [Deinococcus sp.]